jgi:DNA-binding NtrC family response regulator
MTTAEPPTDQRHHPNSSTQAAKQPQRILIAEDNEQVRQQLRSLLEVEGRIVVDDARDGKEALRALTGVHPTYSLFLTDLKMPGVDGMELIGEIRKQSLPVTVIVMTGHGSIDQAVEAMRLGAYDFLTKPLDANHLRLVVQRALNERSLQDEVLYLREQMNDRYAFRDVISKSPRMHAIFELISNVAHTTATVLIEGATGTGKELIAQAIHQASARVRTGPFVAVNCAALPETLLESELFGHEKGAFTGAIGQRQGRFELANGGTLFLDELGEVPASIQAKLLRVLQERCFERIGGSTTIEVDLRLVAATNKSLARLVKKGRFREDLYYRVNVVRIELPLLRQRPEDIQLLAAHFAAKHTQPGQAPKIISPQTMEILLNYAWPGNIRELANVIERACVVTQHDVIEPAHLPPELTTPHAQRSPYKIDLSQPLPDLTRAAVAALERQYIEKALEKAGANVSRCARICGLSRRSLTAKIAEYKIERKGHSSHE